MKKTSKICKLKHTSNYLPIIEITPEELAPLYMYGHVGPATLKQFVADPTVVDAVVNQYKKGRLPKEAAFQAAVTLWEHDTDVQVDLNNYLSGELDRIDVMVKYGIWYKDLRRFFEAILGADATADWSKRKAIAQKATTQQMYGVPHTTYLPEVQAKRVQTTRERYGVDNVMHSEEYKEKLRQTMLERYGVESNLQLADTTQKWRDRTFATLCSDHRWATLLSEYGDSSDMFMTTLPLRRRDFAVSDARVNDENTVIALLSKYVERFGKIRYPKDVFFQLPFDCSTGWLEHFSNAQLVDVPSEFLDGWGSEPEQRVSRFLDTLGVSYLRNHRKLLGGLEVDFYIPDAHIAIEVNPNTTHNSNAIVDPRRNCHNQTKDKQYHYAKYRACAKLGVTLIQLFGYDLDPVVFAIITSPRLKQQLVGPTRKIFARKTTVRQIPTTDAKEFLNAYHSQGYTPAQVKLGMYYGDELVAVATFGTMRKSSDTELKRMCFPPGTQIIGGVSKLMSAYFKMHPTVPAVYTYSDNQYGSGNGYASAGATFVKETGPTCQYVSWTDPTDRYNWQIATPWSAKQGVIAKDAGGPYDGDPKSYVEQILKHRTDDKYGYDAIYTPGSKCWKFTNLDS